MRQYVPKHGDLVRLQLWEDYKFLGLPAWTTLVCLQVEKDKVVCKRILTEGGKNDGDIVDVRLSTVDPPAGWQQRYTIRVAPEKVEEVLGWMKRGIVVRFSQYIGDGSTVFQPLDNSGVPHWNYTHVTDTIRPEETKDLIQVVKLEEDMAYVPGKCSYCDGTGKHLSNQSLEEQTASKATCGVCGIHLGFSFVEPWHYMQGGSLCPEVFPAGHCWVCQGTGKAKLYLYALGDKAKKQARKDLEAEGWKLRYVRTATVWMMERESVVKDFGMEV